MKNLFIRSFLGVAVVAAVFLFATKSVNAQTCGWYSDAYMEKECYPVPLTANGQACRNVGWRTNNGTCYTGSGSNCNYIRYRANDVCTDNDGNGPHCVVTSSSIELFCPNPYASLAPSPSPPPNPCIADPCGAGCTYVLADNTCNVDTCGGCNKRVGEIRSTYDNRFCSSQCGYDATCPGCCAASCPVACGQADSCGGFCPTSDSGNPSELLFSFNPANGGTAPVSGSNTITVSWTGDSRADQWWIELYATGPDPSCISQPAYAQIVLTPSFTFTPWAQCNQYRYRVVGINATCGVQIGAYSAYQDFTAVANINGELFLDADGDAVPNANGMCVDPDGNTPVNWGTGAWAGSVGQSGWVPAYITTNVYGVTVPYWPDVPPNTVNNLVGASAGLDGFGDTYVMSCPASGSYSGIGSPEANVNFYVRSCASGAVSCTPACGQADGCGGTCPLTDAGPPAVPVVTPANGGTATINTTTNEVTVSWTSSPGAELYYTAIWPVGQAYDCNAAYMTCAVVNGNSITFIAQEPYYQYQYQISPVNISCGVEQGGIVSGTFTVVAPVTGNLYYDADGDAAATGPGGICQDPDGDTNTLGSTGTGAFIGAIGRNGAGYTAFPTGTSYTINLPWWSTTIPGNNVVGYDPGTDGTGTPYTCSCPASVGCAYGGIASPQAGVNFFFTDAPLNSGGWWQVLGGHGFAGNTSGSTIYSAIPTSCLAPDCLPYLSTRDSGDRAGSSGGFITGGGALDTSADAGVQETGINQDGGNWFAQGITVTRLQENYSFFYREYSMGLAPQDDFAQPGYNPSSALLPPTPLNNRAYFRNGDLTIDQPWNITGGTQAVVFVSGNLTISDAAAAQQLITVDEGSFLAFIVQGNIIIDDTVGNTDMDDTTPNLEGVYIANGTLQVASNGTGDLRFVGAGNFIGLTNVQLTRDFASPLSNNTRAIETFVFRPDFIRYLPERMARPRYLWQETN